MFTPLSAEDLYDVQRPIRIEIEALDKTVYVKNLSAAEAREFIAGRTPGEVTELSDETFARQDKLVARALVDEAGNRLIPEGEEYRLSSVPYKVYAALADAVMKTIFPPAEEEDGESNPTSAT